MILYAYIPKEIHLSWWMNQMKDLFTTFLDI